MNAAGLYLKIWPHVRDVVFLSAAEMDFHSDLQLRATLVCILLCIRDATRNQDSVYLSCRYLRHRRFLA